MRSWRQFLFRLQPLWSRQRIEDELSEELRHHLEMATAANIAAGMTPNAAQRAAQLELGGIEQVKEAWRDERSLPWLEHLGQDLKYAFRQMRKNPAFTLVVVLSLGLAIGASTAVFSITNQLLIKSLPVRHPEELIYFKWIRGVAGGRPQGVVPTQIEAPTAGLPTWTVFSLRTFDWFQADHPLLADVFAFAGLLGPTLKIDGQPEVGGTVLNASGNYYQALGVSALRGRVLGPTDDRLDAPPVAVISHRFWRARFNRDPGIIGKSIFVNQVPVTIVGVTPPGFVGALLSFPADITLPLAMAPLVRPESADTLSDPGQWWLRIVGRLKPGVSTEQARASLESSFQASARDGLTVVNDFPRLLVAPAGSGWSDKSREDFAGLLQPRIGMVVLLFVAAGANLGNLLLARAASRRREIGMRLALGASRRRIVSQLLVESVLLSILGAGLGTALAFWGADLLWWGQGEVFAFDHRVLGFATALALLTGVGFGLVPALRATRLDLSAEFQGSAHSVGHRDRARLSRTLMVVQVAISFVLLVAAGLFIRTLANLRAVDIGFDRTNLLLFSADGFSTGHSAPELAPLYGDMVRRLGSLPGVHAATYSAGPILSGFDSGRARVSVPPAEPLESDPGAATNEIGPNFFSTLGIRLLSGRDFDERDHERPVIMINRSFAQKYFGTGNPVGQPVRLGNTSREVIGVVADVKQIDLRRETPPTAYLPAGQKLYGAAHFAIRTSGSLASPALLRDAVRAIDSNLPIANIRGQEEEIERQLSLERVFTRLSTFFGFAALALASIGLYGLATYSVQRRTAEFGLRAALGAVPRQLCGMVLREAAWLVTLGMVAGMMIAAVAYPYLARLLFNLSPFDPLTFCMIAFLLLTVALLAVWRPASRAAKIDPMVALRCE